MGLKITQFGGGWGNKAGDCCLLTYGKEMDRHTLIDLGQPDSKRNLQSLGIERYHELENVIFTHLHQDHIGSTKQWQEVVKRSKKIFLPSKTTLTEKLKEIKDYAELTKTIVFPDEQDSYVLSLDNVDDDLNVTIKFIIPDPKKFKILTYAEAADPEREDRIENEKSLGCLITVKDKKNKKWQMLTLGDMEAHSANDRILSLFNDEDKLFVKVIKLPHHGSKNNSMPIIKELMKQGNITVISSGFTEATSAPDLLEKHQLLKNCRGAFYFLGNELWSSLKIKEKLGYDTYIDQLFKSLGKNSFDILDKVTWNFNSKYRPNGEYKTLMREIKGKSLLDDYRKEKKRKRDEKKARERRAKRRKL